MDAFDMKSLCKAIALSLALGTSLPAAATLLGGVLVVAPDGPVISTGGQYQMYVAWVKHWTGSEWEFLTIKAFSQSDCFQSVQSYIGAGWVPNSENSGGLCHGYLVNGEGYLSSAWTDNTQGLSDAAQSVYQESLKDLRDKYKWDAYEVEHRELLRSIIAADGKDK